MKDAFRPPRHEWLVFPLVGLTIIAILVVVSLSTNSSNGPHVGRIGALIGVSALPPQLAGRPAPRIRLRDARGGIIDTAELKGRPFAVTFLYTRCPDVCPLIGSEIQQALSAMHGIAARVRVVAVSVEPSHDTPTAVSRWLKRLREPGEFHYAIGTTAELVPVWKRYFVSPQIPGDPASAHTASIWLVDARGRLRALYAAGGVVPPSELTHDLTALVRQATAVSSSQPSRPTITESHS